MEILGTITTLGGLASGDCFFRADEVDPYADGHRPGQIPTKCRKVLISGEIRTDESGVWGFLPDMVLLWPDSLPVYPVS